MKLSEKLAALEAEEKDQAERRRRRSRRAPRARPRSRRHARLALKDGGSSSWDATKRQVRAPRARRDGRPIKELDADEREKELRTALDKILPARGHLGHAAGAQALRGRDDLRHPRLRPARPAPRRRRRHRGHVQRLRRHLGGARRPPRAHRHQVHRRRPVPPGDREDRVVGRPARRRVVAHGRRPPARRLPRERHHPAAGHPRLGAHHPEVRQGPLHRQGPDQLRHLDPRPGHGHGGRASRASSTSWSPAVPAPARRPTSTCCRASSPTASASSPSRTRPSSSSSSPT